MGYERVKNVKLEVEPFSIENRDIDADVEVEEAIGREEVQECTG